MGGLLPFTNSMTGGSDRIDDLRRRKSKAHAGGGQDRIAAQHAKGKLTARGSTSC